MSSVRAALLRPSRALQAPVFLCDPWHSQKLPLEISKLRALQLVLGIGTASGVQPKRGLFAPKGTGGSRSRCEVILYPCVSEPLLLLQAQHSWKAIAPAALWAGVLLP